MRKKGQSTSTTAYFGMDDQRHMVMPVGISKAQYQAMEEARIQEQEKLNFQNEFEQDQERDDKNIDVSNKGFIRILSSRNMYSSDDVLDIPYVQTLIATIQHNAEEPKTYGNASQRKEKNKQRGIAMRELLIHLGKQQAPDTYFTPEEIAKAQRGLHIAEHMRERKKQNGTN